MQLRAPPSSTTPTTRVARPVGFVVPQSAIWTDTLAPHDSRPARLSGRQPEGILRRANREKAAVRHALRQRLKTFAVESPQDAEAASHKRIAFSSIASNTGARSPGEELMTCNTSAVAVCCSSASRVSVISRAFSIAMTACAAKFCNSAICLSVNGRTSWR